MNRIRWINFLLTTYNQQQAYSTIATKVIARQHYNKLSECIKKKTQFWSGKNPALFFAEPDRTRTPVRPDKTGKNPAKPDVRLISN